MNKGSIQRVLEHSISELTAVQKTLPGMLARAATRRGLDVPEDELELVASAFVQALDAKAHVLQLDIDLPCAMGSTFAQVQATIDILVEELALSLPNEARILSEALAEAIPLTIQRAADAIGDQIATDAFQHANQLAMAQTERAQGVHDLWGPALERLDVMRHLVLEWSSIAVEVGNGAYSRPNTAVALGQLAARVYELVGEILVLVRAGYADGALARWRSLHEVCVVSMFLAQSADRCALMYLWHHKIEEARLLNVESANGSSFVGNRRAHQHVRELRKQRLSLVAMFGSAFAGEYGWAAVELGRTKTTFRSLEEQLGLEKLRQAYKRANNAVHGGALAALTRVSAGLHTAPKADLPPAYGCEMAVNYAVASLAMLVADLCLNTEDADLLTMNMVIQRSAVQTQEMIASVQDRIAFNSPRGRLLARRALQKGDKARLRPSFRR